MTAFLSGAVVVLVALVAAVGVFQRRAILAARAQIGRADALLAQASEQVEAAYREGYAKAKAERGVELAKHAGTCEGGAWAMNILDSGAVHVRCVVDGGASKPVDVILPREVGLGVQAALARVLLAGAQSAVYQ